VLLTTVYCFNRVNGELFNPFDDLFAEKQKPFNGFIDGFSYCNACAII
jgi:hypothetical protein